MRFLKQCYISLIMVLIALLAVACGRGTSRTNEDDNIRGDDFREIHAVFNPDVMHTLRVAGNRDIHEMILRSAGESLQDELRQAGIHLLIEYTFYSTDERANHFNNILIELAAGHGPDIFLQDWWPLYAFIEHGLLADIYELIDRADYFENILEAFEVNGHLYTMPLSFAFHYVGINAGLPQSFIDRFSTLDMVTPEELMGLYNDLTQNNPEHEQRNMIFWTPSGRFFRDSMSNVIDFEIRSADFTGDWFTGYFSAVTTAFQNQSHFTSNDLMFPLHNLEHYSLRAQHYVFSGTLANGLDVANALFTIAQPYFIHYIPVVGQCGGLMNIGSTHNNISISANAHQVLVWEFARHLIYQNANNAKGIDLSIPIRRALFHEHVETGLRNALMHPNMQHVAGMIDDQIDNALTQLERHIAMPITSMLTEFYIPMEASASVYSQVLNGEIAYYEGIYQLQEQIANWFASERTMDYVQLEQIREQLGNEHGDGAIPIPTGESITLRVLSEEHFVPSVRRAGNAMTRALALEGIDFNFEVTNFHISEGFNQEVRLQTLLMSGQRSYDLVLWRRSTRGFAGSGLLTDFYTLIDQHPYTSRDDFFTNVLEAHEYRGGLYEFPLSFGFGYVGINANLPQSIIDRFVRHETITIREFINLFHDLQQMYPSEFGHFAHSNSAGFTDVSSLIGAVAGSYIDFDNRVSHLDSSEFVNFLQVVQSIFYDTDFLGIEHDVLVACREHAQIFSHLYAFWNVGRFQTSTVAWFDKIDPLFINFIPLTDENGRLLLDSPMTLSTWAKLFIPTSGDGKLAWEFIQFLLPAVMDDTGGWWFGRESLSSPINRALAESHLTNALDMAFSPSWLHQLTRFVDIHDGGDREQAISDAVTRLETLNEMPMAINEHVNTLQILFSSVNDLMLGVVSPEEAAQEMHNRISLWLIE